MTQIGAQILYVSEENEEFDAQNFFGKATSLNMYYTCVNVITHPRKNVHNEYGQEIIRIYSGHKL